MWLEGIYPAWVLSLTLDNLDPYLLLSFFLFTLDGLRLSSWITLKLSAGCGLRLTLYGLRLTCDAFQNLTLAHVVIENFAMDVF